MFDWWKILCRPLSTFVVIRDRDVIFKKKARKKIIGRGWWRQPSVFLLLTNEFYAQHLKYFRKNVKRTEECVHSLLEFGGSEEGIEGKSKIVDILCKNAFYAKIKFWIFFSVCVKVQNWPIRKLRARNPSLCTVFDVFVPLVMTVLVLRSIVRTSALIVHCIRLLAGAFGICSGRH